MKGAPERYVSLGIRQDLSQLGGYTGGCMLLGLILQQSYDKYPKTMQSVIFQDVLFAFGQLPGMQTESARKAAINLRQAVMASAFPKRKKGLAVTEFKHAIIAHKRHCRPRPQVDEEDLDRLPPEVVSHIFSFMDLPSLVSASRVRRGFCKRCHSIIRVADLGKKTCVWERKRRFHKIKLISPPQILDFIQGRRRF